MSDQTVEDNTTRATARLPGLDIEIIHRRSLNDEAELISINLQVMPSFEAFGRFLETASPFALWAQVTQMAWLPWLNVARSERSEYRDTRHIVHAWVCSKCGFRFEVIVPTDKTPPTEVMVRIRDICARRSFIVRSQSEIRAARFFTTIPPRLNATALVVPARGGCQIGGRDGRMICRPAEQKNGAQAISTKPLVHKKNACPYPWNGFSADDLSGSS